MQNRVVVKIDLPLAGKLFDLITVREEDPGARTEGVSRDEGGLAVS